MNIVDFLKQQGLAGSTSDARRVVEMGGVTIDGVLIDDWRQEVDPSGTFMIGIGRRRYAFPRTPPEGTGTWDVGLGIHGSFKSTPALRRSCLLASPEGS